MTDPADRFFDLLPAVVRSADAVRGHPLRDLLRVAGEEAALLEEEIRQMYENLFVETAEPWAVPYLGELVGRRPLAVPPDPDDACDDDRRARLLHPRRAVAEHLGLVRRKGTFSVLDDVAAAAAGWPARVDDLGGDPVVGVHLWRLPSWPLTRVRPFRLPQRTNCFALSVLGNDVPLFTRTDPLRHGDTDEMSSGDEFAGEGERSVPEPLTGGRPPDQWPGWWEEQRQVLYGAERSLVLYEDGHPIDVERVVVQDLTTWSPEVFEPRVAVDPQRGRVMFPERHRTGRLTASYSSGFPADTGGGEYPRPLTDATAGTSLFRTGHLVDGGVPLLQRLRAGESEFTRWLRGFIGRSVLDDLAAGSAADPAAAERRLRAELNRLLQAHALADGPLDDTLDLGEEATALRSLEPRGPRRIRLNRLVLEAVYPEELVRSFALVRITSRGEERVIREAVQALLESDRPPMTMVVELADSGLYVEPVAVDLPAHRTFELRAAEGCRPIIVLPAQEADVDDMVFTCAPGSRVVLDGLMVARHAVRVTGDPTTVDVRHCTFVPGWILDENCTPGYGEEPSLVITDIPHASPRAGGDPGNPPPAPPRVRVERSVVGTVIVQRDEVAADPLRLEICRSIVDATADDKLAVAAPNERHAHAAVSVVASTVRGGMRVHALELGENSIFTGTVEVARRQIGCVRFSYVPPGSRTPRRHACQPDLVLQQVDTAGAGKSKKQKDKWKKDEEQRVRPRFMDDPLRYGRPDYCRLADPCWAEGEPGAKVCAPEVLRGADDESEMGVWHDLHHPQREANLQEAVADFLPLGWSMQSICES